MDRISFLGYNIPIEVKNILPLAQKLEQAFTRHIVALVVSYLKSKKIDQNQQEYEKFNQITRDIHDKLNISSSNIVEKDNTLDSNVSSIVFTGIYYILKLAIKTKVTVEYFQTDLNELKLPAPFIADLQNVYTKLRKELIEKVQNDKILFPQLETFKWRVDVIISSSFTSRVLNPVILMEITDTKGKERTFEVSLDTFHKLRYNVSKVLKDMEDLDQLPILKIDK
ncbi:COMM domain-containing protein 5 [Heterostelium album PN500]|uniref:COMM domain-containing protein 5 n=1 Tax=Heterostelium pallidum (strain ATCC 26659 / Pp 5 / PN500) TaxID=670386 RepID=D3BFE0_HETP5|nr:COMM domain-containing protein 5 [Heterostelium album PN500]EFA79854.1 COMM domain-containing protein 5 [Heterostelium album PN500]|eukprot:XP_020431975.1 COMM domain-containing protein 5 [Heterostelium album PN500]